VLGVPKLYTILGLGQRKEVTRRIYKYNMGDRKVYHGMKIKDEGQHIRNDAWESRPTKGGYIVVVLKTSWWAG